MITDRTLADVQNRTAKGFYNISDIKRINWYIHFLASYLKLDLEIVTPKLGEALTKEAFQTIIDNVNKLRAVWYVAADTPSTPIASNWNYQKANDLEKILQAMYDFAISEGIDKLYSGTFDSGDHIKFRSSEAEETSRLLDVNGNQLLTVDGEILTITEK